MSRVRLSRSVNDLDFVVSPYPVAACVLAASCDFAEFGETDPTHRTCTLRDLKTGVLVDLVTGAFVLQMERCSAMFVITIGCHS